MSLSDDEYRRVFKKAKSFATRFGFGDEAEDFAQEYAIKCFESGTRPRLKCFLIDYSDKLRADKRLLSSPKGYNSKGVTVSLDQPISPSGDNDSSVGDFIGVPGYDMATIGGFKNASELLDVLYGRDQEIMSGLLQGYTLKEIAECLRVSESRVSQLASNLVTKALILGLLSKQTRKFVGEYAFKRRK